jgi:hypothetical protein
LIEKAFSSWTPFMLFLVCHASLCSAAAVHYQLALLCMMSQRRLAGGGMALLQALQSFLSGPFDTHAVTQLAPAGGLQVAQNCGQL